MKHREQFIANARHGVLSPIFSSSAAYLATIVVDLVDGEENDRTVTKVLRWLFFRLLARAGKGQDTIRAVRDAVQAIKLFRP